MFGKAINAMRHAWTIFSAVAVIFLIGIAINVPSEQHGSAVLRDAGVNVSASSTQSGGNMEGKETRYGLAETGVFTVGTTDTSTGAVVSSHDSMTPLGGAVALSHLHGRDHAGRCRGGNERHAPVHHPGGVHRRSDGRPNPGVPGEEGRRKTDQAGAGRNRVRADRGAGDDRDCGRDTRRVDIDVQHRRPRFQRSAVCLYVTGQ